MYHGWLVDNPTMLDVLEGALGPRRNADGGFGPAASIASEPEPTAMVGVALADDRARAWLAEHQADDGAITLSIGTVERDLTSVAALALGPGVTRERALDHVERLRAAPAPATALVPIRDDLQGFPWTTHTSTWTEPTAWGLLALRKHRASAVERIDEAVTVLRDRSCVTGGWNYGNRVAFGVELPPFVQTTAIALLALRGTAEDVAEPGLAALERLWRDESEGPLSLATATAALRAYGSPQALPAATALRRAVAQPGGLDTMTLAWGAIALGEGLDRMAAS